ncbi:short-chain dehydrogenase/reductase [Patulibacter americanus]|uniref:short-chain dehydrogenase/reductase n=1 Tax=Patulibacter americanus TaxID=588672 RepID=UPI0003B6C2A6|nr:short-chain dehydrogenase/reductase [Patulibacter americanus]
MSTPSSLPLGDDVALITGAGSGIGLATARALHARGAAVVLVDRDADAVNAAVCDLGHRAAPVTADVTDPDGMREAVDVALRAFGRLTIVVANAGIAPPPATIRTLDPDVFERVIEVNLLGVVRTVQAALEPIIEAGGRIVINASTYAFVTGTLVAPYAVAKSALEQYGRTLRVELAQHDVDVSVAYFGFVDTPMERATFGGSLAQRLLATHPRFVSHRIAPEQAAEALVTGIERGDARIYAPRKWRSLDPVMRVLGPALDRRAIRDAATQAVLRDVERESAPGPSAPTLEEVAA